MDGSKEKQFDNTCLFVIRDPFDEKHNPGRVQATHRDKVMKLFQNAE